MKLLRRISFILVLGGTVFLGSCFWLYQEYRVPYLLIPEELVRVTAAEVFHQVYSDDMSVVETLTKEYDVVSPTAPLPTESRTWSDLTGGIPALIINAPSDMDYSDIPFVYEKINLRPLAELRKRYQLDNIIDGATTGEYHAMQRLIHWIGLQWDHGVDAPPGGAANFKPVDLLESAAKGGRYWCEISAKFTVYAATAMGWPARLVTLSRDGYVWEHAVAEIWSNEFGKWFVVDTDYNVSYEKDGVPLSAFELCHFGLEWQKQKHLTVRSIAPTKPSITPIDLLPYYAYVHIDLRNDWLSRKLRRGSPAGGDLSTWWTSRPSLENLLTAKVRIDNQQKFDWPVNVITISPLDLHRISKNEINLKVALSGYSPYFLEFQWALDDGIWHTLSGSLLSVPIILGDHQIKIRMKTMRGWYGPVYSFSYGWFPHN